jgi:acetyl-CoA carboxylase biotin carboxylase subunit
MINAGIPIVPGTIESIKSDEEAYKIAREIGYPIMLKAAAGGGGKGLRLIKDEGDMKSGLRATKSEALSSFGNDEIYIEKYLENPRHVEFQILADKYGNIIHLYDRECSIQRRHQKVIEESPAPAIDNNRRLEMGEYAVRAAKAVNYVGAGTIEFLVDEEKNFYFLEMNTRLQVEHPVTEMVTGIDIVKLQLEIAMDKRINIKQEDIKQRGSAIECRIYAEDPENNFLPSPGLITKLRIPGGPGIRDDGGVYEGYEVPIYYDPLISKLIVWGRDRLEAINRMRRALQEYIIKGIRTTIPFHLKVMESEKFIKGDINRYFIDIEFLK